MGLFKEILLLPIAPVRGVSWTIEQLLTAAEREQIRAVRRQLVDLEQSLQDGSISSEEFDQREDELLDELEELEAGTTQS